ncbi:hypothetical protein BC834DRAFT_315289 [Gloeopeniophorella convolvens]|nr:hypothetical protein BC834DRAFT_315289 [Gloeopeniophorella convolvens]
MHSHHRMTIPHPMGEVPQPHSIAARRPSCSMAPLKWHVPLPPYPERTHRHQTPPSPTLVRGGQERSCASRLALLGNLVDDSDDSETDSDEGASSSLGGYKRVPRLNLPCQLSPCETNVDYDSVDQPLSAVPRSPCPSHIAPPAPLTTSSSMRQSECSRIKLFETVDRERSTTYHGGMS